MRPRGFPTNGRCEEDLDYFHAYAGFGAYGLLPQLMLDSGIIDVNGARRMAEAIGRTIRAEMAADAMRPKAAAPVKRQRRRPWRRGH